jgi:hypothetical protein
MAGGIFDEKPFVINIKCVIISIIGIILFLLPGNTYIPKNGKGLYSFFIILILLFTLLYVAIAYYDFVYDCDPKMKSGKYSITKTFKPLNYEDAMNWHTERTYLKSTSLFHILFVSPFLIYSGYKLNKPHPKLGKLLMSSGLLSGGYHIFRLIYPRIPQVIL